MLLRNVSTALKYRAVNLLNTTGCRPRHRIFVDNLRTLSEYSSSFIIQNRPNISYLTRLINRAEPDLHPT